MANKDIHVVPAGDQGWAVEAVGGGKRTVFASQEEAIEAGTERAKEDKVELLIHGRDGQIRKRNSFGHDPRNIKRLSGKISTRRSLQPRRGLCDLFQRATNEPFCPC